jgi:membrane protein YdbS with pleckstrin-like domain
MAQASIPYAESHASHQAQAMLDELLMPGEQPVHLAKISGAMYWKGLAVTVVALAAFARAPVLGVFFSIIAAALLALAFLARRYLLLAATDQRIIFRAGIFFQETINLRYSRLESVELIHTPLGHLLGYGNVVITGTGKMRLMIPYVAGAAAFVADATRQLIAREEAPQRVTVEGKTGG